MEHHPGAPMLAGPSTSYTSGCHCVFSGLSFAVTQTPLSRAHRYAREGEDGVTTETLNHPHSKMKWASRTRRVLVLAS